MNPSFDITKLVPSASWQTERMLLLRDTSTNAVIKRDTTAEICAALEPYLRLIARSCWRRYCQIHGKAGLDDIESAGRQGMLSSLQKWDPAYNRPLVHYASRCISETCKAEAISLSQGACNLPRKVRRLSREFCRLNETGDGGAQARLLSESRSRLGTERIVRFLGQSDPTFRSSFDFSVSISRSLHPAIRNLTAEATGPGEYAESNEAMETIRAVLIKECSPRERLIFFIRFPNMPLSAHDVGLVKTKDGDDIPRVAFEKGLIDARLSTIGRLLGVSRERVRQLWGEVMIRIRTRFKSLGQDAP